MSCLIGTIWINVEFVCVSTYRYNIPGISCVVECLSCYSCNRQYLKSNNETIKLYIMLISCLNPVSLVFRTFSHECLNILLIFFLHSSFSQYPIESLKIWYSIFRPAAKDMVQYLHFSKTSLDEPLDVHLCSYFHEQHCVTRPDVIQT